VILVYVSERQFGEVRGAFLTERVSYRNPYYWKGEVEKCDKCYVHGEFPKLKEAYADKLIDLPKERSTDYTIAELREMKPTVEDWESFTEGDNRKSISQI